MKKSVYVCHTFYHAYNALVKELNKDKALWGQATLVLSTMSQDFGTLKARIEASGVFKDVFMFDEKEDVTSNEVMSYHTDRGNIVLNLLQRIKYTRLLGKLQEPYVPVNFKEYDDVYVFCDSDPIGYYLNYKKIPYHAIEDGLNSGLLDDQVMLSNKGAFPLKKMMAKMGFIFIENGYSKYCIDYEVNDIKMNHSVPKNVVEWNCEEAYSKLSVEAHDILVKIFISNTDLIEALSGTGLNDEGSGDECSNHKPWTMILTEPLCDLDTRKRLFGDIIDMYKNDSNVIIKPHPRDLLDYEKEFPGIIVIKEKFPMEVFNDIRNFKVDKLVSVITQIDNVKFAEEVIYLGLDFLDKYEEPSIHRKTELL